MHGNESEEWICIQKKWLKGWKKLNEFEVVSFSVNMENYIIDIGLDLFFSSPRNFENLKLIQKFFIFEPFLRLQPPKKWANKFQLHLILILHHFQPSGPKQ